MQERLMPEDFSWIREPELPRVNALGNAVLYSVQYFDDDGTRRRQIVLADLNGHKVTLALDSDPHHPTWSSDCDVFAYATSPDANGYSTVHVLRLDLSSDECYLVAGDVDTIEFSPDGSSLVVGFLEADPHVAGPRVMTHLRYHYNGRGFIGDRKWQVSIIDRKSGEITRISDPNFHHFSPTWSPDGTTLALVTTRRSDWDLEWVWDVYTVHVRSHRWTCVTRFDGVSLYPTWAPTGDRIAFLHNHSGTTGSTHDYHVCEASRDDGEYHVSCLSHELDRGAALVHEPPEPLGGRPIYDSSGETLYWVVNDRGVYVTLAMSHEGESHVVQRHRGWPSPSPDGLVWAQLVFGTDGPPDVSLWHVARATELMRWDENPLMQQKALCREPSVFHFWSDGHEVDAWLWNVAPISEAAPVLVHFHGGPHGSFGPYFSMTQQILASNGYCVAALNYRGSAGFGQEFADLVHGNWGPQEGEDAVRLIEALAKERGIDPSQIGVFGPSYGGFMTQWMITHYPEKIRRAVAISTVSHLMTSAYGIDHWESLASDQGGGPEERPDYYREHSPVLAASHIQTPLLLLHGEDDMTCPLIEAEMMFVALRWQKKPVEWVRYQGESHSFHRTGRLDTLVDVHQRLLAWFQC